ncbi:MAG: hypothetical protein QOE18_290 [Chloroflexota bacterium]|nr:hypothetical protein [Chloroflexota bacterium]
MESDGPRRPQDRAQAGKSARREAPRSCYAAWAPGRDARVAVDLIEAQNRTRLPWLVPERRRRMSISPFAFFRGAAAVMAGDLATLPRSGLTAQICGDAHVANFGAYASPERQLVFDLNDFDETIAGPWEWDVARLTTSLMIAAQHLEFDDGACHTIATVAVESYRLAIQRLASMRTLDVWYSYLTPDDLRRLDEVASDKRVQRALNRFDAKARARDSLQALTRLAVEVDGKYQIRSDPPLLIPLRELRDEHQPDQLEESVAEDFRGYAASLAPHRRRLLERFRPIDVAIKVVGVGSVGTRCLVMLLEGRDNDDPLFLQIKEANRSVIEEHVDPTAYDNQGQRVVEGQWLMQAASDIFLGWSRDRDAPDYYWRQLRDWKASLDLEVGEPLDLDRYGRLCGAVLARAHARSGDAVAIAAYLGKSDTFDRALTSFAAAYATQNLTDYEAFVGAAR